MGGMGEFKMSRARLILLGLKCKVDARAQSHGEAALQRQHNGQRHAHDKCPLHTQITEHEQAAASRCKADRDC